MRTSWLLIPAALLSLNLGAETLQLPAVPPAGPPTVPAKGMSMKAVEQQFGAPSSRHGAVGGDRPQHPPITRWDYPGHAVFFERGTVIDVVIQGAPAPLATRDGLSPAP